MQMGMREREWAKERKNKLIDIKEFLTNNFLRTLKAKEKLFKG